MVDDIAEREQLEQALTEREMKYSALYNSGRDGILFLDNKGQVVDVNETFLRMSGYTKEEIRGGVFPDSLCKDKTRETLEGYLKTIFEGNLIEPIECQMMLKNGGTVDVDVEGRAVFNKEGEPLGLWMIFRDITRQKTAEKLFKAERFLHENSLKSQSLEETLKVGLLAILDATGLDAGMAGFLDAEGKHFTLAYSYGLSNEFVEAAVKVVSSDERYRGIQESGPIYARYDELPITKDNVRSSESIKAVAIVPIFEDGELIGGVNVGSHTIDEIPLESRYIIESLANQMGRAITKHRLLMAYKESEKLYRALVESSPDSILVRDMDDNIIMASRAALEMHGYDKEEELLGKNILELVAEEDIGGTEYSINEVKEKGVVLNRELQIVRKDGKRVTIEASGSLIFDMNGVPKAILTTSRDITDRKITEERLQKINSELEGYAHMVSHDLRGPVSNIILGADIADRIIEDMPDSEELMDLKEVVASVGSHGRKTLELIQELLDLAEAGQVPLNLVEVDLNGTVSRVVDELSSQIEEKNIRIEVDGNLGVIRANAVQIYQLFSNLIQNAVKHNDQEGFVIEVRRLSPPESKENRFLVRDNGPGIPEELARDVFSPFAVNGKLKKGIGLSIVNKIVEAYDGEVKYYFQDGACFEILLPNA